MFIRPIGLLFWAGMWVGLVGAILHHPAWIVITIACYIPCVFLETPW